MPIEEFPQLGSAFRGLGEDALVHHIADVGGRQVYLQLGRETILRPREKGVTSCFIEFLLTQGQQPGLASQRGSQGRCKGAQAIRTVAVGQDVLGHLVDHQEQRRSLGPEIEHVPDRSHRLFR